MAWMDHQEQMQDATGEKAQNKGYVKIKLPGCEDFVPISKFQYNRIYKDSLGPRLLIIVDECAELLMPTGVKTQAGKEEDALKQEIVGLMQSITQLGRSAGIHMIICTQRNDADLYENEELFVIRDHSKKKILWKELQIGDKFECGSICTAIGEWNNKVCYTLYSKDDKNNSITKITASETHLFNVTILDKDDNKINEIYDCSDSKLIRENINEFDNSWICVKDLKDALNKGYKVILHTKDNETILYNIELFKNGELQKTRCIQTNNGYYDIRNFRSHNSVIPGIIQNNPLGIRTKVSVKRKTE